MAKVDRLQARKTRVEARIAEIEAQYAKILRAQSYGVGFGNIRITRQEFDAVRREYRDLLNDLDAIDDQIEAIQTTGGSSVAVFTGTR